jgi:hypothetical protein
MWNMCFYIQLFLPVPTIKYDGRAQRDIGCLEKKKVTVRTDFFPMDESQSLDKNRDFVKYNTP